MTTSSERARPCDHHWRPSRGQAALTEHLLRATHLAGCFTCDLTSSSRPWGIRITSPTDRRRTLGLSRATQLAAGRASVTPPSTASPGARPRPPAHRGLPGRKQRVAAQLVLAESETNLNNPQRSCHVGNCEILNYRYRTRGEGRKAETVNYTCIYVVDPLK